MSYTYISQKMREYDFYIREARVLPEDLDPLIRQYILLVEEGYRRGDLDRRKAVVWGAIFRKKFGYKYRVLSDKHIIIVPISRTELMRSFLQYPQLMAIVGNRYAGKTITSWAIALDFLQVNKKTTLYVYGDVDGLAAEIIKEKPELDERIVIREDYRLPPQDGKDKIVIYNELSEQIISKRALSSPNLEANLQAFRSRHLHTWVIYNVIRFSSLESVLRETADIKLFKWLSPELFNNAMQYLPKAWGELLKITATLTINENLVIAPVQGRGVKIFIHLTNPPQWLLNAHKKAKKNTRLMMVKSEKERYILERIAKLYEKHSAEEIRLILQHEGINLSKRSIQMKYRKWKELVGLLEEGKKNK